MKNQWRAIVGFILVFIIVIFSVLNTDSTAVNFGFVTVQWPLVLLILCSAVIGALIMLLAASASLWQKGKELKTLKKESEDLQTDFDAKVNKKVDAERDTFDAKLAETKQNYELQLEKQEQEMIHLRQEVLQGTDPSNSSNEF